MIVTVTLLGLAVSTALPALANGGEGGNFGARAGGTGGTDSLDSVGGNGDNGEGGGGGTGGGGGGAGATGGAGGNGNGVGCTGSGAGGGGGTTAGDSGDDGGDANGSPCGGGGGGGGAHGAVVSTPGGTIAPASGGSGGRGGTGSGSDDAGGGGGAGGYGAAVSAAGSFASSGPTVGGDGGGGGAGLVNGGTGGGGGSGGIGAAFGASGTTFTHIGLLAGGKGGDGGASAFGGDGGDGGSGGSGVQFFANGATLTNSGAINGGNGGKGGSTDGTIGDPGAGGAGVVGSGLTVINSGTITGGLSGDGVTQANAIAFTGGSNRLELQAGSSIGGNVVAAGSADTFALGGATNASFDASQIGAGAQYQGFETFEKTGSSTWALTMTTTAVLPWTVNDGTLRVDGSLVNSSFTVNGGTLGGTGTLGAVTVNAGGVYAPGNSIGTQIVDGPFRLNPGGIFEVEVNAAGESDLVVVTGTVNLNGAILRVLAEDGSYALNTSYLIVDNDGADPVGGTFSQVTTNFAFLRPAVTYNGGDGNDVVVTLLTGAFSFCSAAVTRNQCNVANALDLFPADDPLFLALLFQTEEGARQAFDALSGEIHATIPGVLANDSRYLRETILGRLLQSTYTNISGSQVAALGTSGPQVASLDAQAMTLGYDASSLAPHSSSGLAFWTRAYGAFGDFDGNRNATTADRDLGGFLSGVDAALGGNWRIGLGVGGSWSNVSVDARRSSADVDSFHLAGYAGGLAGPFALRGGGTWAWNDIDTKRAVIFPSFFEREESSYDADTGQLFGEIAYPIVTGRAALEPFAGLAYVSIDSDSFREDGALAGLSGSGNDLDVGYSTLGFRLATTYAWNGASVTPHVSAAWQHAFDDIDSAASLAFASTGIGFTVDGVPLAEDTALIEAGLDLHLSPTATLGASYAGQFGDGVTDNAVKGRFSWLF